MSPLMIEDDDDLGIDFTEDAPKPEPTPTDLKAISAIAARLLRERERKAFYEGKLAEVNAAINELEGTTLPDVLKAANMDLFRHAGWEFAVKDIVSGSLTEPKREWGVNWLKTNGHAGLVKHEFKVDLPKDAIKDVKKAAALKTALEKLGMAVVDRETVHPQTLQAWAREMMKDGKTFPAEQLGIYVGRRATVKQLPSDTKET